MVVKGTGEEMLHGAGMEVVSVVVGTNFKEEEYTHMRAEASAAERRV
jgi:K+-transporting ATPase c subunit